MLSYVILLLLPIDTTNRIHQMQIKSLIPNISANLIARIYSIGSIIMSLSGTMVVIDHTIEGWKKSLHIPVLYTLTGYLFIFWIIFSIYALICFSKAKISIRAPLFFLIYLTLCELWLIDEAVWATHLKSWTNGNKEIEACIWLLEGGLLLAFMFFFIFVNYQLLKQANKSHTENEISSLDTNYAYSGFWRRVSATLIDAMVLGTTNALILLTSVAIGVGIYSLAKGGYPHNVIQPVLEIALNDFKLSFSSGITGSALLLITLPFWLGLGSPFPDGPTRTELTGQFVVCYILAIPYIALLYYAFMESSAKQATIGKLVMGIKMTRLDGERISFSRATVRYLSKAISLATLFIGFLVVPFNQKKQTIHDLISGCVAVRTTKS